MGLQVEETARNICRQKLDIHLQRALFRLGVTEEETPASVIANVENMKLRSSADLDYAAWDVGREYCRSSRPDCSNSPFEKSCGKRLWHGAVSRYPFEMIQLSASDPKPDPAEVGAAE